MQLFGTHCSLSIGSWRLQLVLRLDDVAMPPERGERFTERTRFVSPDGDSESRLSQQRRGRCLG